MSQWKTVTPEELTQNPFSLIGKDWGLVTAGSTEKVNTMTISWGGVGIMWGKPVAYIFILPQRYTKQFIDQENTLSLSFYDESYREMLSYMGSKSGKDVDKIKVQNLTVSFDEDGAAPYFEEANTVLCLKKLYKQDMEKDCFFDQSMTSQFYASNDYHTMYVCEITKVFVKE